MRVYKKWKERGSWWVLKRIFFEIAGLFLSPFFLLLHKCGVQRVGILIQHIGHLVGECDCFLKWQSLQLTPKKKYYISSPVPLTSNPCFLSYLHQHFSITTHPLLHELFPKRIKGAFYNVSDLIATEHGAAKYYETYALWGNKGPLFSLTPSHKSRGREVLKRWGIPEDGWFVCLHIREQGFIPETDGEHNYRNANIKNYFETIESLTARGGWVIRMGGNYCTPLPQFPKCIDYALSKDKSDWMDIFLAASCKLFIGCSSGLFFVSVAFGPPCVLVNMVPFAAAGCRPKDLYIPKLMRDKKSGRLIPFADIFSSPIANFRHSHLFEEAGVDVVENTSDEILAVVEEGLLRIDEKWSCSLLDEERQLAFKKLFTPAHYGYKNASRIGAKFLEKHESMLLGKK